MGTLISPGIRGSAYSGWGSASTTWAPAAIRRCSSGSSMRMAMAAPPAPSPLVGLHRVLRRLGGDDRVVDLVEAVDELDPLAGLEHRVVVLLGLWAVPEQRRGAAVGCG